MVILSNLDVHVLAFIVRGLCVTALSGQRVFETHTASEVDR